MSLSAFQYPPSSVQFYQRCIRFEQETGKDATLVRKIFDHALKEYGPSADGEWCIT